MLFELLCLLKFGFPTNELLKDRTCITDVTGSKAVESLIVIQATFPIYFSWEFLAKGVTYRTYLN